METVCGVHSVLVTTTNSIILMMMMILLLLLFGSSFHYGCDCWLWWSMVLVQCRGNSNEHELQQQQHQHQQLAEMCYDNDNHSSTLYLLFVLLFGVVVHVVVTGVQWSLLSRCIVVFFSSCCSSCSCCCYCCRLCAVNVFFFVGVPRPSLVVSRHPLAPSCCYHVVLLFRLFRFVSCCFTLFRVVSHCVSH